MLGIAFTDITASVRCETRADVISHPCKKRLKTHTHTHILKQNPKSLRCAVRCELAWEKPIWTPQTAAASSFDGEASL